MGGILVLRSTENIFKRQSQESGKNKQAFVTMFTNFDNKLSLAKSFAPQNEITRSKSKK